MKTFKTVNLHNLGNFILFLVLLCCLTACESRRTIVNGIDEKEANEILVFLSANHIEATKEQAVSEGAGAGNKVVLWNISLESSQANEAMALLNQVGLPRRKSQNLLNIFSNSSLVPSGMQEKVRYQAGLSEQIGSTIRKIDGVLDADVQISFPEEDPLNPTASKQKITASVYVKHSGVLDDPNSHLMTRIKRLVAGSVNGLDFDNVTVISDRARLGETNYSGYSSNEGEQPSVHVWSLIIAKDSLFKFRLIFFSFTVLVALLSVVLGWLLWKISSLYHDPHGIKKLFSIHPFQFEEESKVETPKLEKNEEIILSENKEEKPSE